MDPTVLYYLLAAVLILVGLAGIVLPALPGMPVIFGGMLLAAWADDFERVGGGTIAVLALLTLLAMAFDLIAGLLGAQRVGASRLALLGGATGTLIGLLFGLPGLLLGPFVGALIGEWIHGRQLGLAARVGFGTWIGMVVGAVVKLGVAFLMLGLFVLALML